MKIILVILAAIGEGFGQSARIVGGTAGDISQVPYQVSLQYRSEHFCGGSIISTTYILSAAHCIIGREQNSFSVRMGSNFHNTGGIITAISAAIKHPNYKPSKENYDFSLLRLKTAIKEFSSTIKAIPLPGANEAYKANSPAIVSGWGATREGGLPSTRLQILELPLVSKNLCSRRYSGDITTQMICAGYLNGGKDSCQGDRCV